MKCRHVQRLLSARHDGDRPGAADSRLAEHLAGCADCRGFEASLSRLDQRLSEWRVPAARAGFADRVIARLASAPRRASLWRELLAALRPAQMAVAAATLAIGVFLANSLFDDAAAAAAQNGQSDSPDAIYSESFGIAAADSLAGTYLSLLEEREN